MCSTSSLRAHDLLWFDNCSSFQCDGPLPNWAATVLREQQPVVVRRAVASNNEIAVGLRGHSRGHLDILMRFPEEPDRAELDSLTRLFAELPVRCDVQMETPHGGVALAEWARGERRMLLKTTRGPVLVANPWQSDQGEQP